MEHSDMKELIDLYAKMIIGTFTFIGPSFTLLVSMAFPNLLLQRQRSLERLDVLRRLESNEEDFDEKILALIKENKRIKNSKDPRTKVKLVFKSLLASLAFIAFYYFQHTEYFQLKHFWLKASAIGISIVFYIFTLFILWQVFCEVIKAKIDEEKEKKDNEGGFLKTQQNN